MRAAIFNPYLDTLGGGERYSALFAQVLVSAGYSVDIGWKDAKIKNILEKRFGIILNGVNIVKDIKRGDGYDLCFWVSDGSIPALKARKNILHFQVPFHNVGGKSLINRMKLFRIGDIVCNSYFTKNVIDKEYGVDSVVIYPPVDVDHIKPKRKENLILFVGRFSQILQNKGQDVLIKSFQKMFDAGLTDWRLVLAGGVEVGVGDYLKKLHSLAAGYPIDIIESPDFSTIKDLYGKAKIFWSASGFGINENKNPEKVEHFGITVVESMSAGAVPVVYAAGGHKEIVLEGQNGFLWNNIAGLIKKTRILILDSKKFHKFALNAKKSSEKYSNETFKSKIVSILQK